MKQGDSLNNLWLYIIDSRGREIYKGQATPATVTLRNGTNDISVRLSCALDEVCKQATYDVVGLGGDRASVASAKVSLNVRVSVESSGGEASSRAALKSCISAVKTSGCDSLEKTACEKIFALEPSQADSLPFSSLGFNSVDDFLPLCEQLGIIKKK